MNGYISRVGNMVVDGYPLCGVLVEMKEDDLAECDETLLYQRARIVVERHPAPQASDISVFCADTDESVKTFDIEERR
jgi:hypothetical protein